MKKIIIPALAIITMSFSPAIAQHKKEMKKEDKKEEKKEVVIKRIEDGHHFGMNLTEDQQKKMEEIHNRTRKENVVTKNQIAEKKAHLKTLMSMDKPDMNDVNRTVDEMLALKSQVMKKELAAKIESRSILTEEQRAMMHDMDDFGWDSDDNHRFMFNMDGAGGNMMFFSNEGDEHRKVMKKRIKIECDDEDRHHE